MKSTQLVLFLPHPNHKTDFASVGRPIEVNKMSKATEEEVLRVQKLYIEEIERIWNEWKDIYAPDRVSELEIVE
jgi:2-acylglycerol O-acyltransferase 2